MTAATVGAVSTLLVAAGGGGDALAATMLGRALWPDEQPLHVATFAWERLRVDPTPGPRGADGFSGLVPVGGRNYLITAASDTVPPGRSTLPRLAGETGAALYLLDARGGGVGLRRQLEELCDLLGATRVVVVDVGGDAVARGDEPELRSPLADGLAIAACTDLPSSALLVAGPGLDGELSEQRVFERLDALGAELCLRIEARHVEPCTDVLAWHPSEATVMLAAAAQGLRGTVETRSHGALVQLTAHSAEVHRLDLAETFDGSLVAKALAETRSLVEAEDACRAVTGRSEIDYERGRAATMPVKRASAIDPAKLRPLIAAYERDAARRGVQHLTYRRLAEALGIAEDVERLRDAMAQTLVPRADLLCPVTVAEPSEASAAP